MTNGPIQAPYSLHRYAPAEAKAIAAAVSTHRFAARLSALNKRGVKFDQALPEGLSLAQYSLNGYRVDLELRPTAGDLVSVTVIVELAECQSNKVTPQNVGQLALEVMGLDDLAA